MGRSISLKSTMMSGVRVLGQVTYIPAHIKNGIQQSARATFSVRAFSNKGTDRKGQPGRYDDFKLTVWNKYADQACRFCSPGKALDFIAEPNSYLGTVYNPDGSVRADAAGQAIQVNKVGFTIQKIGYGEEAHKFITGEIQAGKRPMDWNIEGSNGKLQWANILAQRAGIVWDGQSQLFGYARVVVPQGQNITAIGVAPAPRYANQGGGQNFAQQPANNGFTPAPAANGFVQQPANNGFAPNGAAAPQNNGFVPNGTAAPVYGPAALPAQVGQVLNQQGGQPQQAVGQGF